MTISETQKTKLILLFLLLISSLFILGCSTHGKEDEEDVRYEFCPGKYFTSASEARNMIYYAVNQSSVSGGVKDPNGNTINGSGFKGPVNVADDNGGMWVADGFYDITDNNKYKNGIYTLYFSIKSGNYETKREMNWDGFPTWSNYPEFNTSSANSSKYIYISSAGIVKNSETANYTIKYRIKVYVAEKEMQYSQLFGQSKLNESASKLEYNLPPNRSSNSYTLIPVLVCEMYNKNGKIEKILFLPDNKTFTYNPWVRDER